MAKRISIQKTTLKDWGDVNQSLHRVAMINAIIEKAHAESELARLEIDKKLDMMTADVVDEKLGLERNIELFCKDHRGEFGETRTKEFYFGLVKLRWLPPRIIVRAKWTIAKVLEELKRAKLTHHIRVKEELDKDSLKGEDPGKLRDLGLDLMQDEEFFYEAFKKDLPGGGD